MMSDHHVLLKQAGNGHSEPTFTSEAQQGSAELSFLCQLKLQTSRLYIIAVKHGWTICACKKKIAHCL